MYVSTRSESIRATSKEAILQGLAPDGGLFVMPELANVQISLDELIGKSYNKIAKLVFSKLLDDFTEHEIDECIEGAYVSTFENDEIAPLKKVGNMWVLELFHGPTSAFKDVALTMLPHLMSKALKSTGKKALILTATSGDTGKAAANGFADVENTGICVYYPKNGVSAIQELQMQTQTGKNVNVFAVKGNFDDAQRGVKELFVDEELNNYATHKGTILSSANSINIGRLIPQIVYYFSSYSKLVQTGKIKAGEKIFFSVPTGNFGDVLAGYYARIMGLPIEKLIVACNKNDVLDQFIKTGVYDANREFYKTISPSMDILISSNLERLLYYATNKDSPKVNKWMCELKQNKKYVIDKNTKQKIDEIFLSGVTNEEETKKTIKKVYEQTGYVLDTHSAVSYSVANKFADDGKKVVCLSTASPYKFPKSVMQALGEYTQDEFEALAKLQDINQNKCPNALKNIKNLPIQHSSVIDISEMKESVKMAIDSVSNC